MAIVGKHNVLELVRMQKTPYWKLFETANKRTSSNYIDQADFSQPDVDLDVSIENLRRCLDRLSSGSYLLVSYATRDKTKGGIDTMIEIEGIGRGMSAIGAVGSPGEFYADGIGKVTAENFGEVIEAKFKKMQDDLKRDQEQARLKAENVELKRALREKESGFNKGIMSIGAVAYGWMKDTPAGKEFIGMAKKAMFGMKAAGDANTTEDTEAEVMNDHPGVGSTEDAEDAIVGTLERLSKDNPDLVKQLKKLADLKDKDPDTFKMAVDSLDDM